MCGKVCSKNFHCFTLIGQGRWQQGAIERDHRRGYLIISGPASREPVQFQLWFWSGQPNASARCVTVAGLHGFEHAEGVCSALIGGKRRNIMVSDDGSRKDRRYARFLLLETEQLQIAH